MRTAESTALVEREQTTGEVSPSASQAAVMQEIQGAIIIAKKFPRIYEISEARLIKALERPSLAEDATYRYPRGGKEVEGPSIYFAREAKKCWGNMRSGWAVTADDGETIALSAYAWDIESNSYTSKQTAIRKLIQRKQGSVTQWVAPEERDLRELISREGAKLERQCILDNLPSDLVEKAIYKAKETVATAASKNMSESRAKLVANFAELKISQRDLESYLHHPVSDINADELTKLRQIFKSIRDGNSKWEEYRQEEGKIAKASINLEDIRVAAGPRQSGGNGDSQIDLEAVTNRRSHAEPLSPADVEEQDRQRAEKARQNAESLFNTAP